MHKKSTYGALRGTNSPEYSCFVHFDPRVLMWRCGSHAHQTWPTTQAYKKMTYSLSSAVSSFQVTGVVSNLNNRVFTQMGISSPLTAINYPPPTPTAPPTCPHDGSNIACSETLNFFSLSECPRKRRGFPSHHFLASVHLWEWLCMGNAWMWTSM